MISMTNIFLYKERVEFKNDYCRYAPAFYELNPELYSALKLNWVGNNLEDVKMFKSKSIELPNKGIKQLAGMDCFVNLVKADFRGNLISDLTSVESITSLETLILDNNHISDLSGIEGNISLTHLSLNSNLVLDITPIENLKKLTFLDLGSNYVEDISSLQGLKNLRKLYLKDNKIKDISPLVDLNQLEFYKNDFLQGNSIENNPDNFEVAVKLINKGYPYYCLTFDLLNDRIREVYDEK